MPKAPSPKKNPGRRGGTLRKRSPSPAPEPEDTFGWVSELPEDWTITPMKAKEAYHIEAHHLRQVTATQYDDPGLRTTYLKYKERDVEWKAWIIHGGPVGLWHHLRERRKHYSEQGTDGNGKPEFLAPYEYRAGRRYDLDLDSPPCLPDRYSVGSEILQWCKDRLPCWLWDKLNTILNKTFCHHELTSEREQAMVSALQFFEAHLEYAEGAVARLPMSLDIAPFRMALGRAPKAPSRADSDWGQDRPDLVFIRLSDSPEEDGYYEWDVTCLERIFKGTLNSIHALQRGTNGDAWKTLRWEAYDKYSDKLGRGLRYDPKTESWSDPAAEWLQAKMTPEILDRSLRGMCKAGRTYNDSLPDVGTPPDPSPVPGLC